MQWVDDLWLSAQTNVPVFKINADSECSPELFEKIADSYPQLFCYTKINAEDTSTVATLIKCGFAVVDINLMFSYQLLNKVDVLPDSSSIRLYKEDDQVEILSIAETSFKYSRFHLDHKFPNPVANAIKRAWIQNYILGKRGDALWVASIDEKPVGFLAVISSKCDNRDCAIIDLIGVSNAAQGKGVGTALVQFFQQEYGKKYPILLVGTQAANIPSVRLYEKLGFRLCESKYVLHFHK
jgi:ribosomal protein S18 acetylase RimI-like enzyme